MKNNWTLSILICLSGFLHTDLRAQNEMQVLFWNVENLFYPDNDSLCNDDEFTADGNRHWSYYRYWQKINLLWKTILSIGEDGPPDIIGLCEIENRRVLEDLFLYSPLRKFNYKIIHKDSPDSRGIDVALIFRGDKFDSVYSEFIVADFPELNGRPTRDILHARLYLKDQNLDLFVNHWPSKYGGAGITDILRIRCADLLLKNINDVQQAKPDASIICMGDFNDITESRAIQTLISENKPDAELHLLEPDFYEVSGSLKYQGRWETIDNFFVNNQLYFGNGSIKLSSPMSRIYSPAFLLEKDAKYGGKKPFRTYLGYKYNAGVSDHLPIWLGIMWYFDSPSTSSG